MLVPKVCFAANGNGVECSQLGMIPNDATQGRNNLTILLAALRSDTKVLVDDKYYLTGLGTSAQVDQDIIIEGITSNAEFSFTKTTMTQSNFIKVAGSNVLISKVRFVSAPDESAHVFRSSDDHKINTMSFENCYFEGPIRLVGWTFTNSVYPDPDIYNYGMDNFKFINNKCNNITKTLISISDVPIRHSQIINNEIRNFSHIFYNNQITNTNVQVDKLAPQMTYLEVKGNTVINDASWDGNEFGINYVPTYHCFIFFEGNRCEYKNNHVEGLHLFDQRTAVYDAYLSCIELEYENNFWKNNTTFISDPTYTASRQFMKSKDSPRLDGYKNIQRVYRNNTFIMEKSYADVMGRPYEELWMRMIEFDRDIESLVVENNKIDAYILRLNSANVLTHNLIFSNNEIHATKTLNSSANSILAISVHTHDGIPGTYIARNNTVTIDMPGSTPITNNSLISYHISTENVDHTKVIFEDNYVSWPDMETIIRGAYTVRITNVPMDITIKGNTVITAKELVESTGLRNAVIDLTGNTFTVATTAAAPSAAISNATVNGTVGTAIAANTNVSITLTNDTFASSVSAGTNVSSWFNLPTGLTATVSSINATKNAITVTISGTPSVASSAVITVSIPAANLATGTAAFLAASTNTNAKYAIVNSSGGGSISGGGGGGGGGGAGSAASATTTSNSINPTTASFDKTEGMANHQDIIVTLTVGSGKLSQIKNDSTVLKAETDYTVSGNTYTIKATYLATLPIGTQTIVFDMNSGTDPSLSVVVSESDAPGPEEWVNPFTDVNVNDWFYSDVKYVYQNELFSGTSTTEFSPNMPMTRGMIVTVLGRLAEIDVDDYRGASFSDVDVDRYYAPYVKWAVESGLVNGIGDEKFAPDENISRQDLAVIIDNYAKIMGLTLPNSIVSVVFNDTADIADYAQESVAAMQMAGIINGNPGNVFEPLGNATRAEVATMLHRFCEAVK